MQEIKFVELFAGVGGFRFGIEKVLENAKCVYSNEWDKYANSVYRKHYGECDNRDIRTVKAEEIPEHDLLVGGFPCQAFSVAGKRGGFDDTRGTLFFEVARILKEKKPKYVLLENVKGLLSHDKGRTFQTILGFLSDLGYECQWQVLNSKNFGVPQNRERVFIAGNLRGTTRPKVFPIIGTNQKTLKFIGGLNKTKKWIDGQEKLSRSSSQGERVYDPDGISTCLSANGGGLGAKTGLYAIPVLTPDRAKKRQNGRRFKTSGEPSFTLTAQDTHGVVVNRKDGIKKETDIAGTISASDWRGLNRNQDQTAVIKNMAIRKLTPIETERLQAFPSMLYWTDMNRDELIALALTLKTIKVDAKTGKVFVLRGPGGINIEPREAGTECNGYLVANISASGEKKQVRLHRVVWISENGVPEKGMAVCHRNNNKKDNRIENLYLATNEQNTSDASKDGLLDGRGAKIDFEIAQGIRMDYKTERYTMRELAKKYHISKSRIHQIIRMQGWTAIDVGGKPVSDSQRYKMMGNAVTTSVISAIISKMFN